MGRYPGGGARYAWGVGIPRVVGIPGYITKSPAPLLTASGGHQIKRYTSYWNAFLL